MTPSTPLLSRRLTTAPGPPVYDESTTNGSNNNKKTAKEITTEKLPSSSDIPPSERLTASRLLYGRFPTLHNASILRIIKSVLLLTLTLTVAAFGAKYMGLEIFQDTVHQAIIIASVVLGLGYTGVFMIDFWEIVVGWWWISVPLLLGTGVVLVMMQESSEEIVDID